MNIETVTMVLFLATGNVTAYPPTTYHQCEADLHVIWRWSRIISIRKSGHLAIDGVPVVGAECVPVDLQPCEVAL